MELEPKGLYLTHLFREVEVILTPDWQAVVFVNCQFGEIKADGVWW